MTTNVAIISAKRYLSGGTVVTVVVTEGSVVLVVVVLVTLARGAVVVVVEGVTELVHAAKHTATKTTVTRHAVLVRMPT